MHNDRAHVLAALAGLTACAAAPLGARAGTWLAKPVELIESYAPGGPADVVAHAFLRCEIT